MTMKNLKPLSFNRVSDAIFFLLRICHHLPGKKTKKYATLKFNLKTAIENGRKCDPVKISAFFAIFNGRFQV